MIQRVFLLEANRLAALQRLGAATMLQWASIPSGVQDSIVQQALALDWHSAPELAEKRIRDLLSGAPDDSTEPSPPAGDASRSS